MKRCHIGFMFALLIVCCVFLSSFRAVRYDYAMRDSMKPIQHHRGFVGMGAMSDGFHQYKRVGREWVINEDAERSIAQEDARKRELMKLLQSRVLTASEMAEVEKRGRNLNIYNWQSYREIDKQLELNEALLQQFKLRLAAENANSNRPTNNQRKD